MLKDNYYKTLFQYAKIEFVIFRISRHMIKKSRSYNKKCECRFLERIQHIEDLDGFNFIKKTTAIENDSMRRTQFWIFGEIERLTGKKFAVSLEFEGILCQVRFFDIQFCYRVFYSLVYF